MNDALIHLRVPAETKARWVRRSRAEGMRLTDWIIERVEGKMIKNIELTEAGAAKFNRFFARHAKKSVSMQAVMFEVLDVIQERVDSDEALEYELGRQYTISGNPELFTLSQDDIIVTEEPDE